MYLIIYIDNKLRKNLIDVLWQMLVASDEIDLKASLRACCQGHDFISMSNAFLVINLFSDMIFSNSLNKKGWMVGQNYMEKDRSHACLRVNNFSFPWWA